MAHSIEPIAQIGKGGLSDNSIKALSDALDARELIKITVLNNCEAAAANLAEEIEKQLGSQTVAIIGHKIIMYRRSTRDGVKHIEF